VLKAPDGSTVHEISSPIGWASDHHVAEYRALIAGLRLALGHGVQDIRAYLDSALVVDSVNRVVRVGKEYFELCAEALGLIERFKDIKVRHVPRRENAEANSLATKALRLG
jgi:ribonuclease HI